MGGELKFKPVMENPLLRLPSVLCCPQIPLRAPAGGVLAPLVWVTCILGRLRNSVGALDCTSFPSLFLPPAEENTPPGFCIGCSGVWGDRIMIECQGWQGLKEPLFQKRSPREGLLEFWGGSVIYPRPHSQLAAKLRLECGAVTLHLL